MYIVNRSSVIVFLTLTAITLNYSTVVFTYDVTMTQSP